MYNIYDVLDLIACSAIFSSIFCSCVIGEEFNTEEVPRNFHTLQLNLFELVDGARQQRLLGRLKLSRKEMLELGKSLQSVSSSQFGQFLRK
jgi:hypothetical protein